MLLVCEISIIIPLEILREESFRPAHNSFYDRIYFTAFSPVKSVYKTIIVISTELKKGGQEGYSSGSFKKDPRRENVRIVIFTNLLSDVKMFNYTLNLNNK